MPIDPNDFRTGGALQSAVAASLVRQRDATAELAPGAQIGIYRVLRELARGGMAIVYLAERADGEYEQQVALKWMLQAQPDAASEALFRRERQALADLRHPHIARLLDGGRSDEGRPWFAMELIAGERLDTHCVQAGLPQAHRLILFQQVCAAVAFAHARGVIHRDIKPSNVMVDRDHGDDSAKLLDFGIAQLLGQDNNLAARAYTPGFASPEQQRGEALTVRSDVYQLGRLLASLLSMNAEEQATIATHTVATVQVGDAAASPQLALPAGLGTDLLAILHKACAADPLRRYATAEALADDVRASLECRPVAARPRRASYIAARYLQRHPFAVGLGVFALLTLVATVAAFTWRLAQERDNARLEASRAEASEEFLVSLFRVSDPGVNRGEKLTARELLDRGAARAESDVLYPPRLRARLLQVLTQVDYNLGEFDRAHRLLERALAEDPKGKQRLPLLAQKLWLLQRRGQTVDAVRAAPAILAEIPATPEHDRVRADALNAAALAAWQTGDARARDWQAQALTAATRAGDPGLQGRALRTRGLMQELAGDDAQALESTTLAAQKLAMTLGDAAPDVLSARTHRAYMLSEMGQTALALDEIEAVRRIAEPLVPPDHMLALDIDATRSWVYLDAGRADEAFALARDVAERCGSTLGENHMDCSHSMAVAGDALMALGRTADAIPWFERLVSSRSAGMGQDHIYTAHGEHRLAEAYCKFGRYTDGLPIAVRISERFARELPQDNADRRKAQATLELCNVASPQAAH